MTRQELLQRVVVDPSVCGGAPCIRGTRTDIGILLDSLAEGMTMEEIVDHFPHISVDDVRAAIAYASDLTRERVWRIAG